MFDKECPACGGDGELATSHKFRCYDCGGSGRIHDPEQYDRLIEEEKVIARERDNQLRASEYRQMGG